VAKLPGRPALAARSGPTPIRGSRSVPFHQILGDLLDSCRGSIGAVFLDHEGESVALRSERVFDIGEYGLKAIGAYSGMFLNNARRIANSLEGGNPDRLTITFEHAKVLSCPLKDGYYVVLVVDHNANEGQAWQQLAQCRERLLQEI
jgi:predicted regulator of Ras-like GTPase activity (Roadblock/LC7/MglB family)